jgi:hypothetical protein
MANNIDFELHCIQAHLDGICQFPASAFASTMAGIVDCTVGNVANPNAIFHSVQEAIDNGCFFIRVLDGLFGGQVPGYLESAFTVPTANPVMIYWRSEDPDGLLV